MRRKFKTFFQRVIGVGFGTSFMEPYYNFFVNLLSSGKPAEQCSLLTESGILTRQCPASFALCNLIRTTAAQVGKEKEK